MKHERMRKLKEVERSRMPWGFVGEFREVRKSDQNTMWVGGKNVGDERPALSL